MGPDVLTGGSEVLQPGEVIAIAPVPGYSSIVGQVLGADAGAITIHGAPPGWPSLVFERIPVERIVSVERRGVQPLPATIVRTYNGHQQADANTAFQAEAQTVSFGGYEPTTQSWAQGQWGIGAFFLALILCFVFLLGVLVFIYLLVVKPEGTLTVTYSRREPVAAKNPISDGTTKVCPRCAETIKAAAVVCRYCGHEFGPIESMTSAQSQGSIEVRQEA